MTNCQMNILPFAFSKSLLLTLYSLDEILMVVKYFLKNRVLPM